MSVGKITNILQYVRIELEQGKTQLNWKLLRSYDRFQLNYLCPRHMLLLVRARNVEMQLPIIALYLMPRYQLS